MRAKNPYPSGGLRDFGLAEKLLTPHRHVVDRPVRWKRIEGGIETVLPVSGAGLGVKFRMEIRALKPHEPKLQYLHPQGFARRLCVNAPHRPITGTHKHKILPNMESAYEPDDIPPIPMNSPVTTELYREILEAFINECHVALGPNYTWTGPPN